MGVYGACLCCFDDLQIICLEFVSFLPNCVPAFGYNKDACSEEKENLHTVITEYVAQSTFTSLLKNGLFVYLDFLGRASPPGHKKSRSMTGTAAPQKRDYIFLTIPIITDGDLRGNSRTVPML